jgi:uncharacterized membrane protein YeiH
VILATAAAIGGGLARDVLLGVLPPAALTDSRYLLVPLVAAGVVFVAHGALGVLTGVGRRRAARRARPGSAHGAGP